MDINSRHLYIHNNATTAPVTAGRHRTKAESTDNKGKKTLEGYRRQGSIIKQNSQTKSLGERAIQQVFEEPKSGQHKDSKENNQPEVSTPKANIPDLASSAASPKLGRFKRALSIPKLKQLIKQSSQELLREANNIKPIAERAISNTALELGNIKPIAQHMAQKLSPRTSKAREAWDAQSVKIAYIAAGYDANSTLLKPTFFPSSLTISDPKEALKPLGKGMCNTVYKTTLNDGKSYVIKFEDVRTKDSEISDVAGSILRPVIKQETKQCLREAARNCLTKQLDTLLGWDVVVDTTIGVLPDPKTGKPQVAIAMGQANGFDGNGSPTTRILSAQEYNNYLLYKTEFERTQPDEFNSFLAENLWANPREIKDAKGQIQLEVDTFQSFTEKDFPITADNLNTLKVAFAKLQLLDSILMSVDRNPGNYKFEVTDGVIQNFNAIDNDILGGIESDFNNLSSQWSIRSLPQNMPKAVTEAFLERANTQDFKDKFEALLKQTLTQMEVQPAMNRLDTLIAHLKGLRDSTIAIDSDKAQHDYYQVFINRHNLTDISTI